jgi:predicted RNA-binding protein YlxR (DUF448 family)
MNTTKKKSNPPIRRCLVTGEQLPKESLIRLVRTPDGLLSIDLTGKLNGRGAYIKKDPSLFDQLKKGNFIQKQLHVIPDEAFFQRLLSILHA